MEVAMTSTIEPQATIMGQEAIELINLVKRIIEMIPKHYYAKADVVSRLQEKIELLESLPQDRVPKIRHEIGLHIYGLPNPIECDWSQEIYEFFKSNKT